MEQGEFWSRVETLAILAGGWWLLDRGTAPARERSLRTIQRLRAWRSQAGDSQPVLLEGTALPIAEPELAPLPTLPPAPARGRPQPHLVANTALQRISDIEAAQHLSAGLLGCVAAFVISASVVFLLLLPAEPGGSLGALYWGLFWLLLLGGGGVAEILRGRRHARLQVDLHRNGVHPSYASPVVIRAPELKREGTLTLRLSIRARPISGALSIREHSPLDQVIDCTLVESREVRAGDAGLILEAAILLPPDLLPPAAERSDAYFLDTTLWLELLSPTATPIRRQYQLMLRTPLQPEEV